MSIQDSQKKYMEDIQKIPRKDLEMYQEGDNDKFILVLGTKILFRYNTYEEAHVKMVSFPVVYAMIGPIEKEDSKKGESEKKD